MASTRESILAGAFLEDVAEDSRDRELPPRIGEADWTQTKRPVSILVRTIEGEIIPRLVLAHRIESKSDFVARAETQRPSVEHVVEFTRIVLENDVSVASDYAKALIEKGISLESLFLELFAPAARRLGEFWVADLCDFTQVTIGVGRLQQLLREFARDFCGGAEHCETGRRALLAPTPGEQHTFGMLIVGEFLRRSGWDVTGEPAASRNDLCELVHGEWFGVVGLSLSSETRVQTMQRDIRAIRNASRNVAIGVIVGGKVFVEHPEYVERVGADAMAVDGIEAVERAEELLADRASTD